MPDASPDHPSLVTQHAASHGWPQNHHDISTTHIRPDPVTDTDLPHIYRGLSDPQVVAYYGVSYDSLAACRAQMDWYAELTRTGRGAWHLIRDRHTGEPLGPSATTMPTRLTGVPSWATGSIPNTGAGVMSAALQLWLLALTAPPTCTGCWQWWRSPTAPPPACWSGRFSLRGHGAGVRAQGDGFISLRHYAILRSDLPASL